MKSLHKTRVLLTFLLLASAMCGCKRLVEVDAPYTSTNSANVYATDATAAAVLTGIYSQLSGTASNAVGIQSMSYFGGLCADDFTLYSGITDAIQVSCYRNGQVSSAPVDMWNNIYPYVYYINAAIEGLNSSSSLTPTVKQQLLGESKFMRAFFYFYLVNLYGDVPLILTTDYTQTAIVPRTPKDQVYLQITRDLKDAQGLLSDGYLDASILKSTTERIRPNRWAATAFLARVYLYMKDYPNAETQATAIINDSSVYSLNSLANTFQKNNPEAIWQWQPVVSGYNTQDARFLVIPSSGPSSATPVYLSNRLLNSFEANDMRRTKWITSVTIPGSGTVYNYPSKYKVNTFNAAVTSPSTMTEYTMVFRVAEQFLIRAEARAQQNNIPGAQADLNAIRKRAGLGLNTDNVQASLLSDIQHERQVELFAEWGHRWFDMKRTGTADAIMGGAGGACQDKGGSWKPTASLFPISLLQLQRNTALMQNPGY